MKNKFITFEGIDGAGKSTIITKVAEILKNSGYSNIFLAKEPNDNIEAISLIKNIILNCDINLKTELLLFEAARSENIEKVIEVELGNDKIVLCDRFTLSTNIYQKKGASKKEINWLNDFATFNIKPGLIILLDIEPKESLKRIPKDRRDKFETKGLVYFNRLRKEYLKQANKNSNLIKVIDASLSEEEVLVLVVNEIIDYLMS